MNIGQLIKEKIIEGENQIRKELIDAFINGDTIIVNYNYDNNIIGYNKSNTDNIEHLIYEVIKNNYKYEIKKGA